MYKCGKIHNCDIFLEFGKFSGKYFLKGKIMVKFASIVTTKNHRYYIQTPKEHVSILESFQKLNIGIITFEKVGCFNEFALRNLFVKIDNIDLFPVWVKQLPDVQFYQELPWRTVLQNNN
jgi:hypothetical protein